VAGELRYPEDGVAGLGPQTVPMLNDDIEISYWDSSYSSWECQQDFAYPVIGDRDFKRASSTPQ
jgi:hypothetical protein